MEIYTIGFTKRSAEDFFNALAGASVQKLLDTRLRPDSQLSGFARARDLPFFLRQLINCRYEPLLVLAPTKDLLDSYRQHRLKWTEYEVAYRSLLKGRDAARKIMDSGILEDRCALLCSENSPDRCHRRLAAEYLAEYIGATATIAHL